MYKSILALTLALGLTSAGIAAAADTKATPLADEDNASTPYYPASCLTYPLPEGPGEYPSHREPAKLLAQAPGLAYIEDGHITIWRQPCNPAYVDEQWQPRSALLLRVERSDEHPEYSLAVSPAVYSKRGGALINLRLAADPNTVSSHMAGTTMEGDTTYVIEEWHHPAAPTNLNGAVELMVKDVQNRHLVEFEIEAFQPSEASYPELYQPMPISGLLNGIFSDPQHSGEGLNVQVLRVGDKRIVDVAWFTYDSDGTPFWIGGAEGIDTHDRSVEIALFHTEGGGFAGDFGGDVERAPWGNLTLEFDNCNTVSFDYEANADLPDHVPGGSGTKTWQRLARIDELDCS